LVHSLQATGYHMGYICRRGQNKRRSVNRRSGSYRSVYTFCYCVIGTSLPCHVKPVDAEPLRRAHGGAAQAAGGAPSGRTGGARRREREGRTVRAQPSHCAEYVKSNLSQDHMNSLHRELARDLLQTVEGRNRALLERERARLRQQRDRELLRRREAHDNLLAMLNVGKWEDMLRAAAVTV
jgi:hypothetical protein